MEILILGLILVALMAWASTKIKRAAAEAYEREAIDRGLYTIVKPDGFICPTEDNQGTDFSAYSRKFGVGDDDNTRRATASIERGSDPPADAAARIKQQSGPVEQYNEGDAIVIEQVGGERSLFYKIFPVPGGSLTLRIEVLPDFVEEYRARIDEMIASFELVD